MFFVSRIKRGVFLLKRGVPPILFCPSTNVSHMDKILISPSLGFNVSHLIQRLFKRQVQSCLSADDFACASGDCIDRYEVCDGIRNCRDGSDETSIACKQVYISTCPPVSFQCDYGACISVEFRCDGKNDCVDGSDEAGCGGLTQQQQPSNQIIQSSSKACNSADSDVQYWQCANGQCIDLYSLCDGILDCSDQSDETEQICFELFKGKCPPEQWRCTYGACLHRSAHCNGRKDCWDGSDEIDCQKPVPAFTSPNNRPISPTLSGKGCKVPSPAEHREFALFEPGGGQCQFSNCMLSPGQKVASGVIMSVTCREQGYQLGSFNENTLIASCNSSYQWFPAIPTCLKLCPKLASETLDLTCWQGPYPGCNKPMVPGTRITYSCKQFYQQLDASLLTETLCKKTGQWTKTLPSCTPLCGQSGLNTTLTPTIVGGNVSKAGDFPWHAALFIKRRGIWAASCGGTLINTHIVLTAAHCVTTSGIVPPPMNPENLRVVLGKYLREWDEMDSTEIRVGVKEVVVHHDYRGDSQRYAQDIALLILERKLTLNNFVMPVCVDYNSKNKDAIFNNLRGYIAGWGNTEECVSTGNVCDSFSPVLKYTRLKTMTYATCYNVTQNIAQNTATGNARPALQSQLTPDKICAGDGKLSVVQVGDSGGGLTFMFGGLHYVYGIVSTKLTQEIRGNRLFSFAAFTNVPKYMPWLKKEMEKRE